jgi:hypothetical protein
MASEGKSQLLITFVAAPEKVGEMDRLVSSHARWIAETHHREGSKALLSYDFSKGRSLRIRSIQAPSRQVTHGMS